MHALFDNYRKKKDLKSIDMRNTARKKYFHKEYMVIAG